MQMEDTMKKDQLSKQLDEMNILYKSVEQQINKQEKDQKLINENKLQENKTHLLENVPIKREQEDFSLSFVSDPNKKLKCNVDKQIFDDFIKSRIVKNKEMEIDNMKNSLKEKSETIKIQKEEILEYEKQIDEFTELLKGIRDMFSDKGNKNSLALLEKINMNLQSMNNKKLEDLEKDKVICELQEHLVRQKMEIERIKYLEQWIEEKDSVNNKIIDMEQSLIGKDNTIAFLKSTLENLKTDNTVLTTTSKNLNISQMNQIKLENTIKTLQADIEKLNNLKVENENLIEKLQEISEKYDLKIFEIQSLKSENELLKIETNTKATEIDFIRAENLELIEENKGNHFRENILKERILDLQGNIRVFLRIRKPLDDKKSMPYKIKNNIFTLNNQQFNFDYIYSKNTIQKDVFDELELLIKSAFNGYSVIISCYGQTGSGKTYTMEGKSINNQKIDSECGIFPRSIHTIYEYIKEMTENNYKIEINFSAVEIYNDKTNFFVKSSETRKNHKNLEIIYEKVKSKEEIFEKYQYSISKRKIAETNCNKESSRSHFITFLQFTIEKECEKRIGKIAFIDLAGSERITKSSVKGDRLKETTSINTSLLGLRNVLYALKEKDNLNTFIPYRNCTLTHLLKPLFENKIRMVMIINISDLETDLNETVCSLRFGEMSREVKFGKADKNIELNNE